MLSRRTTSRVRLALIALTACAALARAQNADSALQSAVDADPWPRKVTTPSGDVTIYQPQLDAWKGNALTFHAAVAIVAHDSAAPVFGVVFASARTAVDKEARMVSLEDMAITGAKFPSRPDSVKAYLRSLKTAVPATARTISLDRLQANLLIATDLATVKKVKVKNAPPTVYFSTVPAILVLIDGAPALRPVAGTSAQRVINTGAMLVYDGYTYYLHVFDGWMQALQPSGPWAVAYSAPPVLDSVVSATRGQRIDMLTGASQDSAEVRPSLYTSTIPVIYTSSTPAELIVTQGPMDYVPIGGTDLLYVSNTSAHVFEYIDNQQMYILLGGRWFTAPATYGPWTFVPGDSLPADFRNIPEDSPVEPVLASVPGTPQAAEALIENSVPQTGAVSRSAQMPAPAYDGAPQFKPIDGTNLQYVVNAPVPVIRVSSGSYFSVYHGVWFSAPSVSGPWTVAAFVPAAVYTIPPSSPLYYVTYVQVYGATSTVVYVGYTPGYYGTVVVPGGVVVYGTGYVYSPWVGAYYYPPPMTYGFGATVRWTPWTGWSVGFGFGCAYDGVAVSMYWGGAMWGVHPYYGPAYYGGYYGAHGYVAAGPGGYYGTTGNVYSHYGSTSMMTNTSGGYNAYTGNGYKQSYGTSYNSATGVAAAGQRTTVANAYTGGYQSYASGTATNTRTGTTATGYTNTYGNAYTGQQVKTGQATVSNPYSGKSANVSAVQTNNGGAVSVNNNVYADHNGNVYSNGGGSGGNSGSWSQWNGGSNSWDASKASNAQTSSLNSQAWSRSAGSSRSSGFSGGGGGSGGGRR